MKIENEHKARKAMQKNVMARVWRFLGRVWIMIWAHQQRSPEAHVLLGFARVVSRLRGHRRQKEDALNGISTMRHQPRRSNPLRVAAPPPKKTWAIRQVFIGQNLNGERAAILLKASVQLSLATFLPAIYKELF